MTKFWLASIVIVVASMGFGYWVEGTRSAPRVLNPADEARATFKAKCAGCHGPDLAKPRGRFGYVLDLGKIAANPEMVVPGRPEESELWALVEHDEMPPEDSPQGPLTPAQKETIRNWIAAGAPE